MRLSIDNHAHLRTLLDRLRRAECHATMVDESTLWPTTHPEAGMELPA
jgi:hypothetical protein